MPRQLYLRLLGLQILIVAAVLTVIMAQFSHVAVTHGGAGLMFFYYVTMRHIGFSFGYSYYTFMCGVVMLVLLAHRWQEKPAFLLGGMWMVLANAVVYVVSCNIGEYRDLFWSMPVMVMLSAHSIVMLTDMDKWPLFARFTPSST